jgi:hypothetical protein
MLALRPSNDVERRLMGERRKERALGPEAARLLKWTLVLKSKEQSMSIFSSLKRTYS